MIQKSLAVVHSCQGGPPATDKDKNYRLGIWISHEKSLKDVWPLVKGVIPNITKILRIRQRNGLKRLDFFFSSPPSNEDVNDIKRLLNLRKSHHKRLVNEHIRTASSNPKQKRFQEYLSLISWNIRGLWNKQEDVDEMAENEKQDLLFLQETLVGERRAYLSNYQCIQNMSTNEGSDRGLAIGIRRNLKNKLRKYKESATLLACTLDNIHKYLLVNVYIPNRASEKKAALTELASLVDTESRVGRFRDIIIGGNWNNTPERSIGQAEISRNQQYLRRGS